mmetsp:Transcript_28387/g.76483  ORF Transcript_28387/g.76483 Transcript_28387/m.76483 type:complete len:272 (+) Transcript_28387:363-1178(+)
MSLSPRSAQGARLGLESLPLLLVCLRLKSLEHFLCTLVITCAPGVLHLLLGELLLAHVLDGVRGAHAHERLARDGLLLGLLLLCAPPADLCLVIKGSALGLLAGLGLALREQPLAHVVVLLVRERARVEVLAEGLPVLHYLPLRERGRANALDLLHPRVKLGLVARALGLLVAHHAVLAPGSHEVAPAPSLVLVSVVVLLLARLVPLGLLVPRLVPVLVPGALLLLGAPPLLTRHRVLAVAMLLVLAMAAVLAVAPPRAARAARTAARVLV